MKILAKRIPLAAPAVVLATDYRQSLSLKRYARRRYTRDAYDPMAFQFRMGAGFFGDVDRTHPFWIDPGVQDPTNPPLYIGSAVTIDATSKKVRRLLSSDGALTHIWGIVARPFPFQDPGTAGAYGAQTLGGFTSVATNQPVDVLRSGYVMSYVNGTPGKGDPVYVWIAATASPHNQDFFEQNSDGGSTILITPVGTVATTFNGPPDANGCGEIIFEA